MRELYEDIGAFALRHWEERERKGLPTDSVTMTERYVMALHREVDELLDEVPWKDHRKRVDSAVIVDNVLEEIADVIFYAWSLARRWGASYDELVEAMATKRSIIEHRWKEEHDESELTRPVALIDLDGVLSDWPEPFLLFADIQCGHTYPPEEALEHIQTQHRAETIAAKHHYRLSGFKRHLPPKVRNCAAVEVLDAYYDIVIMSKRPAHRYSRIYGDTLYWLGAHGVPFKRLVFTEDKPLSVVLDGMRDRIAFAVDDDIDNVDKLRDLGIKVYHLGKDLADMTKLPELEEIIRGAEADRP